VERRAALATSSGPARTTAYRVVHGENDGLPGLVVDRYGDALVVKLYSAVWFAHLDTVVGLLVEALAATTVVLRLARTVAPHAPAGLTDGAPLVGEAPTAAVRFVENGLTFEADVVRGQKTGHFLDQRENRALVRSMADGTPGARRVLLHGRLLGARGGGRRPAPSTASTPARRRSPRPGGTWRTTPATSAVMACHHATTVGDAFEVMQRLARQGERYDLVVIDPPSFAQRQSDVGGAVRAYRRLAALGVALVEPGGVLFHASCSSRVTGDAFFDALDRGAGADADARLVELTRTGHALDHPVGFAPGRVPRRARRPGRAQRDISGEVTFSKVSASDVTTSTTAGRGEAIAASRAGPRSSGCSTRAPSHPMADAMAAWSNAPRSDAMGRSRWPWSTHPSARLFSTTIVGASPSSRAVMRLFIPMAKPPSPQTATAGRSGCTSSAASAAGIAYPIAPTPAGCTKPGAPRVRK
jgi:23S rRNA (cytosine1962-C5)-methyltransferase